MLSTVDYYSVLLYLFDLHKLNLHCMFFTLLGPAHLCNFVFIPRQLYKPYSLCRNTVLTLDCITSVNELAYSECRRELLCMFLKCPAQSGCCVLPIFLQSPIGSGELHLCLLQKRRRAHNQIAIESPAVHQTSCQDLQNEYIQPSHKVKRGFIVRAGLQLSVDGSTLDCS